jgi:hypothetical protein
MTRPNDHPMFGGRTPEQYIAATGDEGLVDVRRLLEATIQGT